MGIETLILERDAFLREAVGSLLQQIDTATLALIVTGGEDQFIGHAKTHWVGHGFKMDDLKRAFRMLQIRATQVLPGTQTEQ
jgi:hypothetical protein